MSINTVIFPGNLGGDCTTRSTTSGKLIATFSLPVKQGYGEYEKTSWVQCRMFGAKAEKLPIYLARGSKVTVIGQFSLESWPGKDGTEKQLLLFWLTRLISQVSRKINFSKINQYPVNLEMHRQNNFMTPRSPFKVRCLTNTQSTLAHSCQSVIFRYSTLIKQMPGLESRIVKQTYAAISGFFTSVITSVASL